MWKVDDSIAIEIEIKLRVPKIPDSMIVLVLQAN